jgi:two-component system sensor histidine kinase YesM
MKRPERHPRFRSIQVTMAFAFSVLAVSMIVTTVLISYALAEDVARRSSRRYTKQLVDQVAANIESYVDYMESVSSFVLSNQDIQDYLRAAGGRDGRIAERAAAVLDTIVRSRRDISLVAVFAYDGRFVAHNPEAVLNPFAEPENQPWFAAARAAGGDPAVSTPHVQNVVADRYRWVISLSREITDLAAGARAGVLLVDLNFDVISHLCGSVALGKRGYLFIVDRDGSIVYHPQQQLLYGGLKSENIRGVLEAEGDYFSSSDEEGEKFYSVSGMPSTGWKVVGVNFGDELVENREEIRLTFSAWGIGFFALTVVLSIVLALRISRPIKRLRRSMQAVEMGNFDIRVDIQSADEIGALGKDFNIMIAEIRALIEQNNRQQELKRKSELKALQMQINPHFLYNTLDSIIWMAEGRKEQEVIAMVSALARLFRLSLGKGKEIVDIGSEVEHVRHYLTIQKIRYKDRLDYEIDVDPDILKYKTVKIILQPLVENAIYHGIKNKATPGKVTISGCRTAHGVELIVRDDGIGMSRETLARLSAGETEHRSGGGGLGVRNVDERIKLYFGKGYGLDFESAEDKGTTVHVRLPAAEEVEEQ